MAAEPRVAARDTVKVMVGTEGMIKEGGGKNKRGDSFSNAPEPPRALPFRLHCPTK